MDTTLSSESTEAIPRSRQKLARLLGERLSVITALTEEVREAFPETVEESAHGLLLSPEAQQLIDERRSPAEGMVAVDEFAKMLEEPYQRVVAAARRLSCEDTELESELALRRSAPEEKSKLFMQPHLATAVKESLSNRKERERQRKQADAVEDRFGLFAEELKTGETLNSQEFRKLVEIFGPENSMDLLIQFRPEFNEVPVDMVSSFLTDYLGSFLIAKGKLDLDNLSLTTEFLSNQTLKSSLVEVVKQHCHTFYQHEKRDNPQEDDLTILSSHLDSLREKIVELENDDLMDVLQAVEDFYTYLFVEVEKPENFVYSITGDRPFPDLSQRINVGEMVYEDQQKGIYKKRRMLIADDPRMGKSASAIMAKEHTGAKCAVILAPGSVVDVWKSYLSDKVDTEMGKQIGYFQPGKAPRVLTVTSPNQLDGINEDDYDYIILSHGRLREKYTNLLQQINFDMLIVDEAHEFRNIEEGIAANELIKLADYVAGQPDSYTLMLSATPAPNKVSDIAMVLRVLYPNRFVHEDGTPMTNKELALQIIKGDYIDLRSLLVPLMQRKLIKESIKMPELIEEYIPLELSSKMQEIYELFLDDDELTSTEKIQRFRQFLNNPATFKATPDVESVKAVAVGDRLRKNFETEDKIMLFVSDYVTDIIVGEHTIHEALNMPDNVEVITISGENTKAERDAARESFQNDDKKILLIVSGKIAGLGLDFSAADRIGFYNEPWNKSRKRQMWGRGYSPGRTKPLYVDTFYFPNTFEEGLHYYIEAKEIAIQKLLHGIQLTELEQKALIKEEESPSDESIHDINPELAAYYYSSWQRMLRMFGYVKELGEKDFTEKFLPDHGVEYARTYRELMNRSYQANAARLSGSLITNHLENKKASLKNIKILDLASGPEMLKSHIPEELADSVISLDINKQHFTGLGTKRMVGSMKSLPFNRGSLDYVNMSLALHYTKQLVTKGIHERTETIAEINRVLKVGGRATITMLYSVKFEDEEKLYKSLASLGFKVVSRDTGEVESKDNFKASVLTIEKTKQGPDLDSLSNAALQRISSGLKIVKTEDKVKDTKKIVDEFWIKSKQRLKARLTQKDQEILQEETEILAVMNDLKKTYKGIKEIPAEQIIMNSFSRIYTGRRHVLFARLKSAIGAVVLR